MIHFHRLWRVHPALTKVAVAIDVLVTMTIWSCCSASIRNRILIVLTFGINTWCKGVQIFRVSSLQSLERFFFCDQGKKKRIALWICVHQVFVLIHFKAFAGILKELHLMFREVWLVSILLAKIKLEKKKKVTPNGISLKKTVQRTWSCSLRAGAVGAFQGFS